MKAVGSITAHLTAAQGILLHIFIWPAGVGLFYSIECRSICYFNNERAAASFETMPPVCTRPGFGLERFEITCKMASFAMFLMTSFLREGAAVRAERNRPLSSLSRAVLAISRLLRPEPSWASSFSNATCSNKEPNRLVSMARPFTA